MTLAGPKILVDHWWLENTSTVPLKRVNFTYMLPATDQNLLEIMPMTSIQQRCWKLALGRNLAPCIEQMTGSGLRKEYDKAAYCHPIYLIYTQRTLWESLAGWVTSWNQDCQERCQEPQICGWHHSNWQKVKRNWRTSWSGWKKRVKKSA